MTNDIQEIVLDFLYKLRHRLGYQFFLDCYFRSLKLPFMRFYFRQIKRVIRREYMHWQSLFKRIIVLPVQQDPICELGSQNLEVRQGFLCLPDRQLEFVDSLNGFDFRLLLLIDFLPS